MKQGNFYIITFDDIENENTKQLMFDLCGMPNGTILSMGTQIRVNNLSKHKWIYWIDDEIIDRHKEQYQHLSNMKGIECVMKLDINKSIYDNNWEWNDDYINNLFIGLI